MRQQQMIGHEPKAPVHSCVVSEAPAHIRINCRSILASPNSVSRTDVIQSTCYLRHTYLSANKVANQMLDPIWETRRYARHGLSKMQRSLSILCYSKRLRIHLRYS